MTMRHLVTSSDGANFVVDSANELSKIADRDYARGKTAAELIAHGDFEPTRTVNSWDAFVEALGRGPKLLTGPPTPAQRRAQFRLIRGGRA
jgi:hypothetical protein